MTSKNWKSDKAFGIDAQLKLDSSWNMMVYIHCHVTKNSKMTLFIMFIMLIILVYIYIYKLVGCHQFYVLSGHIINFN